MSSPRFVAAAFMSLALLAGCGGESDRKSGEEDSARAAAQKLPAADRIAFYQLATVDGLIRSRAVVATTGGRIRVSLRDVADARRRVDGLAPRDKGLARARDGLARALAGVAARRPGAPARALRGADAAYLALREYQRQHPAVVGLVPD